MMSIDVMELKIDVAEKFSPFPFGRISPRDGDFTGQKFRDNVLKPELDKLGDNDKLIIDLNGVLVGIGSSFLSEAFGGAIEKGYISKTRLLKTLTVISDDDLYATAIIKYISEAKEPA
jgi:hypothetical protein